MPYNFPPQPAYPYGIDNDQTLYLVFNTSETVTTAENNAWASEIPIKPVGSNENEVWSTNGFANINGELFYYGSVGYDSNNKINEFRNCARNLGGTNTKHNKAGSEVRGFVVAEHHNQIADAIIKIEDFIGENFTTDQSTLDWRIRHLQELPVIFDDFSCPDITFDFVILSENPATGILAQYTITINGSFTSYRLDFGDGQYTTTSTTGTHQYSPSATIDPILTIANSKCTIVQSPKERNLATQPQTTTEATAFSIPIPAFPTLPTFFVPTPPEISNIVNIPPIVFPCLEVSPFSPSFPSIIVIEPPLVIPSIIVFTPAPSIPTLISFGPAPYVPPIIEFGPVSFPSIVVFSPAPSLPSLIGFGPVNIPTLILFGPVNMPTIISFAPVNFPTLISIATVNFPTIISITPVFIPTLISITPVNIPTLISITPVNIPTLISITPVNFPTLISITPVDIPTLISITPVDIPTLISITPVFIPTLISITPVNIPTLISITPIFIPTLISITPVFIPTLITITPINIPTLISITPVDIPTLISITPVFIPTLISITPVFIPTLITITPINIPTLIRVEASGSFPSTINFGPAPPLIAVFDSPPTIPVAFGSPPAFAPIAFGSPPGVPVIWGSPPACSCTVTITCPSSSPSPASFIGNSSFLNDGMEIDPVTVHMADLGIPKEIMVIMPEIPDIRVIHDIPAIIQIESPNIPNIKIIGPDKPIPSEIRIVSDGLPSIIELVAINLPESIKIDASGIPSSIKLELPDKMPTISIDATGIPTQIQVVGIPSSIELIGAPSEIKLVMPDNPEIELVYKGAPIDVKINLDISRLTGDPDSGNCVAIVPCGTK